MPQDENMPGVVAFGREICADLALAETREWWLTNGLGGYAAGTVPGTLSRRYHGLLIAPVHAPLGRMLLVAKADASLRLGNQTWPLFSNRWASGAVVPRGHVHLQSFRLDGRMPVWRYAIGGLLLEQRIWMDYGLNATRVAFRLLATPDGEQPELDLCLMVNCRDHHHVTAWPTLTADVHANGSHLCVNVAGETVHAQVSAGAWRESINWIENFHLARERERGLEDQDTHLKVAEVTVPLEPRAWAGLTLAYGTAPGTDIVQSQEAFTRRERGLLAAAETIMGPLPGWISQLVLAADSFVFARPVAGQPEGESIIAGYPWFGDWGRDTMIALPGLTLATGRQDTARRILETFAQFVDQGMLPNVFPGRGETAEYNTADAALWYIEAWRAYVAASGDLASLRKHFGVLEQIIQGYRDGTRYAIGMDDDGLVHCGEPGVQVTWMDARIGDWVVTPRIGKPVEINALWYNALCIMREFARRIGVSPSVYEALSGRTRQGFQRFCRSDGQGLYDVLDGSDETGGNDARIRPNQVLAVSLTHSPLEFVQQQQVVTICSRELLTSFGLRSLAAFEYNYRGQYNGDVMARDSAYHQGPVWGWLLGHFVLAEFRLKRDVALAERRLEAIQDHLADAGLGSISEIFEGDAPHRPRGAPLQAWSVAGVLEAWWRIHAESGKPHDTNANG